MFHVARFSKHNMKGFALFLLLSFVPCLVLGGVYQWTDEDGQVHFENVPPRQQDEYSLGTIKKSVQKKPARVTEKPAQIKQPVIPAVVVEGKMASAVDDKSNSKGLESLIIKLREDAGKVKSAEVNVKTNTQKMPETKQGMKKRVMPAAAVTPNPSSDKKVAAQIDEQQSADSTQVKAEKDADKCGFFIGFVEQYQTKKSEGCPGQFCDVYKRQLEKFLIKQDRYCQYRSH